MPSSVSSSTSKNLPSRSMTAATVTLGFHTMTNSTGSAKRPFYRHPGGEIG
jgi:hypothetical protein